VLYATMTKTDMALYRLSETYAQIKSQYHINPLVLVSAAPTVNQPIEVISGYWQRGYTCRIEKIVNELREAGWTFKDSFRYSQPGCETIGGTSGSPVILAGSRQILGSTIPAMRTVGVAQPTILARWMRTAALLFRRAVPMVSKPIGCTRV